MSWTLATHVSCQSLRTLFSHSMDLNTEGMGLSTIHANKMLNPWQKYTMMALSVLLKLIGGDICFDTEADLAEADRSGELALGE